MSINYSQITLKKRQQDALYYAETQIYNSPLYPYVNNLILFGSCARKEERYDSDVDLLMVLNPDVVSIEDFSANVHYLKGTISSAKLDDAETDLKVVIGNEWETESTTFFKNIQREGICIWH